MRLSTFSIALLPLVAARPVLPDLSVSQWGAVEDTFGKLSEWTWNTASGLVNDDSELTIWQIIEKDPGTYSRLTKVLKFEEDTIKVLDNSKDGFAITFFAASNDALTPPKHDGDKELDLEALAAKPSLATIAQALECHSWLMEEGHDSDDKDKKRRRAIFKKIAHAVLQYNILPQAHSAQSLAQNSTMATTLKPHDGSAGGLARRIRIEKQVMPPTVKINFWAEVKNSMDARNGKVHEVNHPIFPPGSIFDEMFLVSKYLSQTTTALQGVHGRHYVDWHYDHESSKPGKPKFWGTPLATMFAPSNAAWDALPDDLHFFLFSRFGHHALAKLLAYHYVPHTELMSEILHKGKHDHKHDHKHKHKHHHTVDDDPSFHHEFEVHTGLGSNATLKVVVDKTRLVPIEGAVKTTIKVNDKDVKVIDIPASNGAWHVLDEVLCPPHHHHDGDHDSQSANPWADWQTWLPAWAEEA